MPKKKRHTKPRIIPHIGMRWDTPTKTIVLELPITSPTGKVRLKRPTGITAPTPVATKRTNMLPTDYLEWQISYDTDDRKHPTIIPTVIILRGKKTRYGCELTWLIKCAHANGLLTPAQWASLRTTLDAELVANQGIQGREQVLEVSAPPHDPIAGPHKFIRSLHHMPLHLKSLPQYSIEVKIAPKQRAVGTQAMIFVRLPLSQCVGVKTSLLPPRNAFRNEKVRYTIDSANIGLIHDTILAFILASGSHALDINAIFRALGL